MTSILFTGYAPVHYACFRPLHQALEARGVEVDVAGGTRSRGADGAIAYDGEAMFGPFGVDLSVKYAVTV